MMIVELIEKDQFPNFLCHQIFCTFKFLLGKYSLYVREWICNTNVFTRIELNKIFVRIKATFEKIEQSCREIQSHRY